MMGQEVSLSPIFVKQNIVCAFVNICYRHSYPGGLKLRKGEELFFFTHLCLMDFIKMGLMKYMTIIMMVDTYTYYLYVST